jgi:hypothetical protein
MSRTRLTGAAKQCISDEIRRHCDAKPGKCRKAPARKQAVAIAYSVCRRKGSRSIPSRP